MSDTNFMHDDDAPRRLDMTLWKRIFTHALPYRHFALGLIVSGVALAALETAQPALIAMLLNRVTETGVSDALTFPGVAYAVNTVLIALAVWLFIWLAGRIATGVAWDLRKKGFDQLQELSFSFYDVRPVGWLVSRLTSDVSKVSSIIPWFLLDLAWGTCFIGSLMIAMLILNWKLALIVLAIVPPLAITSVYFQRKLLESSRHVRRTNSIITASFNESIMGVRTTKTLAREHEALGEFQVLSSEMFRWSVKNALQSATYLPMVVSLGSVGIGLALWRGGVDVRAATGMKIGELVAFMQYAALFSMPVQELAARFTQLQAAQAAAERIQTLLDEVPQVRDTTEAIERIRQQEVECKPNVALDGLAERIDHVQFKNVSFHYKEGEPVLDRFNLTIQPGQTIALVGATGSGKSTIVNLLARFYEPTGGQILLNGVDYRERSLGWLQSNLGVVMQTPHLFSGSIRDNIRYGRLSASDDEVIAAARLVNAHGFIERSENGYDTEVGEAGSRLSTGQRQLVALARAVLADPQIFIMDEATSSVDTETEQLIQHAIETVLEGRFAVVIAHRLSTIRSADVILMIDRGIIIEQGTHSELMKLNGRYANLYNHHFVLEAEAQILGE